MKRVAYFFALSALLATANSALAQSGAAVAAPSPGPIATSTPITTRLSIIALSEPATEEGFATVRIADERGEAVYRGMMLIAAGARSLDLSAVRIPAAGRYTIRVIYPGGTVVEDVETPYTVAGAAKMEGVVAGQ